MKPSPSPSGSGRVVGGVPPPPLTLPPPPDSPTELFSISSARLTFCLQIWNGLNNELSQLDLKDLTLLKTVYNSQ